MCGCIHPEAEQCMAVRHGVTLNLLSILDATCKCHCHRQHNGHPVLQSAWIRGYHAKRQKAGKKG